MRNVLLVAAAFTAFIFSACSDDEEGSAPTAPGVYVVGYEEVDEEYYYGQAKIWKDDEGSILASTADYGTAYDVFVSGNDVYVAGASQTLQSSKPAIWKNGKPTTLELTEGFVSGSARKIAVASKDVYAIGFVYDAKHIKYAALWKNGKMTVMEGEIYLNGLAVSGSDVYVGGTEYLNSEGVATIWKNGVASRLGPQDGTTYTGIDGIFVSGADVYATGKRYQDGMDLEVLVWKNGVASVIATNTEDIEVSDIHVSGSDVYVSGLVYKESRGRGVIWKNGVATELTDGTIFSTAKDVFVANGDVYVTGFLNVQDTGNPNSSHRSATLWTNGVVTDLSTNGSNFSSEALSVFVVK